MLPARMITKKSRYKYKNNKFVHTKTSIKNTDPIIKGSLEIKIATDKKKGTEDKNKLVSSIKMIHKTQTVRLKQ